jgi:hypothetical protein
MRGVNTHEITNGTRGFKIVSYILGWTQIKQMDSVIAGADAASDSFTDVNLK